MKSLFFGTFKGCLITILGLLAIFAIFFMIFFDAYQYITHQRTYFMDVNEVEAYDEPIFTDYEDQLIANLDRKNVEINTVKDFFSSNLSTSVRKFEIEFGKNTVEEYSISTTGKSRFWSGSAKLRSEDTDELLELLKWDLATLKELKNKLESASCISISSERNAPIRIGHKNGKHGMFLYNFYDNGIPHPTFQALSDSCTFKYFKEDIFFEYDGKGRGPDCKRTTNHPNTEKSLFEKWRPLLRNYESQGDTSRFNLKEEDFTPIEVQ